MINESCARITCKCGEVFQVLKTLADEDTGEEITDWDEKETVLLYEEHMKKGCDNPLLRGGI